MCLSLRYNLLDGHGHDVLHGDDLDHDVLHDVVEHFDDWKEKYQPKISHFSKKETGNYF